ncbi:hypothetical protein [Cardiobacterium valvarum]|nr:hypothetical protein [Cardiobacterium valvarum]
MQHRHRLFLMLAAVLGISAHAATSEYYGPGYTLISAAGDDSDLQTVVYRQLYPGTVGQALPQLLEGTGWRLADSYAADVRIYRLYNQPLPEHKLRIGPMALDKALTNLAGEGWELVVDPVNRLVSFEVRERYDTTPRPLSTTRGTTVTPSAPVYADTYPDYTASYPVASAPYPSSLSGNTYSDNVVAQGDFSTLHYLNDPAPVPSRVTSKRRADATPIRPATQRADDPADAVLASGRRVTAAAKAERPPRRTAAASRETAAVETENTRKSRRSPSSAVKTATAASTPSAVTGKPAPDKGSNAQHSASAANAETKNSSTSKRVNRSAADERKAATATAANNKGKTGSPATVTQTADSAEGKTAPSTTVAQAGKSKAAANPAQSPATATQTATPTATSPKETPAATTSSAPASKAGTAAPPTAAPAAASTPSTATENSATAEPALLHQQPSKPASTDVPPKADDAAAQPAAAQPSAAPASPATTSATDSHATITATASAPSAIAKPPLKTAGQPVSTGDVVVGRPASPRPPLAAAKAVAPGEITPAVTEERAP